MRAAARETPPTETCCCTIHLQVIVSMRSNQLASKQLSKMRDVQRRRRNLDVVLNGVRAHPRGTSVQFACILFIFSLKRQATSMFCCRLLQLGSFLLFFLFFNAVVRRAAYESYDC